MGMGAARARRGVSPLIATVILIGITVIGGALVYAYFNKSVDTMAALGEDVFVWATAVDLGATGKLVYIEIINNHEQDAVVTGIIAVDQAGTETPIALTNPLTVAPGGKASIAELVPANTEVVIVEYTVNGSTLLSEPITIG